MKIAAIVVAAGRGLRAGGGVPKQYRPIGGVPVLERTFERFLDHARIDQVVVVISEEDRDRFNQLDLPASEKLRVCHGGATRTASVRAGLEVLQNFAPDAVMIHDAARPFISDQQLDALAEALEDHDAVMPALPIADALLLADETGRMLEARDRDGLMAAQTPQCFNYAKLMAAYERLGDVSLPDDAAVARQAGLAVMTIPGDADNFKLTLPADFERAERMLADTHSIQVTGQGFDVHRLEAGDRMWLCGVPIEAGLTLAGHSDADVALHAVTDAVLGAAGEGDIGQHFPPSDPQWKGASSDRFLRHAVDLLKQAGGELVHADLTIIGEKPRIGPYRDAMRDRLAELLDLPRARVNIKATTTEKLGFAGRGEGLAAQAIVTARMR